MQPTSPNRGQLVFVTELGFVGIAWSERGLRRLVLPSTNRDAVIERLARRATDADPPFDDLPHQAPTWVGELVEAIKAYASGVEKDFSTVPLDLGDIDAFRHSIYAAAQTLAFGETTTYGELAARAGHPGLARETGAALGANPVPLVVPCHRILAAGGKIGGFSAPGGSATKEKMLQLEGVRLGPPPSSQASFGF